MSEDGYNIHMELIEKGRSCKRKLKSDNRVNIGDDMVIGTSESSLKYYSVDIR